MFQTKHILAVIPLSLTPLSSFATPMPVDDFIALSAYLGGRYSDQLKDSKTGNIANISHNFSQALALSWYYDRNKEGELLYSTSQQNLSIADNNVNTGIDISYLHFGGRINFVNGGRFSTSFGLGLGATFFIPDEHQYDNDVALSGNMTGGIRYTLNQQWALKADLRVYATVLSNNSSLFCSNNTCLIELDGDIYVQTELMAGIEYKF